MNRKIIVNRHQQTSKLLTMNDLYACTWTQLTVSVVSLLNVITILFSRSTSVGVSGGGGGTIKWNRNRASLQI